MRRLQLPILLLAILAVSSCDNDDVARVIDPPAPTIEEQVIADCYVVRDALEAFAAENGGVYPYRLTDQSDAGNQFITFLPGDTHLTNRYTGLAYTPLFYEAQWPGDIGVVRFSEESGPASGYRIIGRGRYGELIRLENLSQISDETLSKYELVFSNCAAVVNAVEEFAAQNGGGYPGSVGADALLSGDVLTDLLPGGSLLVNPHSGYRTDPVDGPAAERCEVGYSPQDPNGDGTWDGYYVEALGLDGYTTIAIRTRDSSENAAAKLSAQLLRTAAEEFASQSGGEYPRDIDTDETPAGDTLLEILSCAWCTNPYTGTPAIRNGLATSRGEVGYVPLEFNGIVVGYVINALGLFNEELERFEVVTN